MSQPWEDFDDEGIGATPWEDFADVDLPPAEPLSSGQRLMRGVMDPIHGGAQLLESAVSPYWSKRINELNNRIAATPVGGMLVSPVGAAGVAGDVAAGEKEYKRRLAATPGFGAGEIDLARIAGNVVSPANVGLAVAAGPRAAGQVITGAVAGAAQPSEELPGAGYWGEKAAQAGAGAAGVAAARGLARVISPNASVDPQLQLLRREGVTPTVGQILGGIPNRIEQASTSIPIVGSTVAAARQRAAFDFNRAIGNRALGPIGAELPGDVPVGHEMVDYVGRTLNDAYAALLPNLRGAMDAQLTSQIGTVRQMAQSLPDSQMHQLNRIIRQEIEDRFTGGGLASGETIKNIESKLGGLARGYMRDTNYDNRQMGAALRELQANLREMIARQNPDAAPALQNINRGWAELVRLEDAAARAGAREGVFTPGQYLAAVRHTDPTMRKRQFSRGQALGQDIGTAAQMKLGNTLPNSGTTDRAWLAGLLGFGAAGALSPRAAAAGLGTIIPYTTAGQTALDLMLAGRPAAARPVAGALRRAAPYFAAPAAAEVNLPE